MARDGQSGVLSKIKQGSCLTFQFAHTDQWIGVNEERADARVLVPTHEEEFSEQFLASVYEYNGGNQARVVLAWGDDPRYSWNVVQEPGLENAIMLGPPEPEFLFNENRDGLIQIINAGSYVGIHQGPPPYLATGFTDAPWLCSLFAITFCEYEN